MTPLVDFVEHELSFQDCADIEKCFAAWKSRQNDAHATYLFGRITRNAKKVLKLTGFGVQRLAFFTRLTDYI